MPELLVIGCVKCGREVPADRAASEAVFETCETCGKTVGFCLECAFLVGKGVVILSESMEWHQQVRHATEPLTRAYG